MCSCLHSHPAILWGHSTGFPTSVLMLDHHSTSPPLHCTSLGARFWTHTLTVRGFGRTPTDVDHYSPFLDTPALSCASQFLSLDTPPHLHRTCMHAYIQPGPSAFSLLPWGGRQRCSAGELHQPAPRQPARIATTLLPDNALSSDAALPLASPTRPPFDPL